VFVLYGWIDAPSGVRAIPYCYQFMGEWDYFFEDRSVWAVPGTLEN